MKSLYRKLKPIQVDQLVYFCEKVTIPTDGESTLPFPITESPKDVFRFMDGDQLAHRSKVFRQSRLLKSFGFQSPLICIGDCFTSSEYRGRGLYPSMLNHLKNNFSADSPIYILVSPQNKPSILGIEKAGFVRIARIQCLKIGPIYLNKRKEMLD